MTSGEAFPVPTPRYGQLLGASFDVARAMQHPYVGVEHPVLAILRDRDAVPTQSLAMQIDLDEVEARLLDVMQAARVSRRARRSRIRSRCPASALPP